MNLDTEGTLRRGGEERKVNIPEKVTKVLFFELKFLIIMGKMSKKSITKRLYAIYEGTVVYISLITFVLFVISDIPQLLGGIKLSARVVNVADIAHSLMIILCHVLGLICATHLIVILIGSFVTKHSLIWLIGKYSLPLFIPLLAVVSIKFYSNQLNDEISSLIVGVIAGIASSIIVLILDRKAALANNVLKHLAWEYSDEDKSKSASSPLSETAPNVSKDE